MRLVTNNKYHKDKDRSLHGQIKKTIWLNLSDNYYITSNYLFSFKVKSMRAELIWSDNKGDQITYSTGNVESSWLHPKRLEPFPIEREWNRAETGELANCLRKFNMETHKSDQKDIKQVIR